MFQKNTEQNCTRGKEYRNSYKVQIHNFAIMKIFIDLSVGTPVVDLEELEALVADIKALSKKEIKHDNRAMKILGYPEIDERRIYAEGCHRIPTHGIRYLVEDYVLRRDGSGATRMGSEEYDSRELRKS